MCNGRLRFLLMLLFSNIAAAAFSIGLFWLCFETGLDCVQWIETALSGWGWEFLTLLVAYGIPLIVTWMVCYRLRKGKGSSRVGNIVGSAGGRLLRALMFVVCEFAVLSFIYALIFFCLYGDPFEMNTYVSPGFDHDGFFEVKRGATEDSVLRILGEPLCRVGKTDGTEWWEYSRPKRGHGAGSYHRHEVFFDGNGVVVDTLHAVDD